MTDQISPREFQEALGAEGWRVLGDGASVFLRTGSFSGSARLAQAIGVLDGIDANPPAVDVRANGVTVRLLTIEPDYAGMTSLDLETARRISALARELGVAADPTALQSLLIVPGAPDIASVVPFWRAVLGYEPRADSPEADLVDAHDRGAPFWFEGMNEPRPDGGGAIHIGVWVPSELAEARVAAALAAGGRLVRDDFAPSWWTLADPAGNEADISTVTGRD